MLVNLAYYSIDPRVRIMAADRLLDRGYGKAPQAMELSGPDGGPIAHEMTDKEACRMAAFFMKESEQPPPANDKVA